MNNKQNSSDEATTENLLGVAQRVLGNLESIGGVLTGDPMVNAEGAFNANVGTIHQETSRVLNADEPQPEADRVGDNSPIDR